MRLTLIAILLLVSGCSSKDCKDDSHISRGEAIQISLMCAQMYADMIAERYPDMTTQDAVRRTGTVIAWCIRQYERQPLPPPEKKPAEAPASDDNGE